MPKTIIDGPARTPVQYGLFSALPFTAQVGDRWEMGATWQTGSCGTLRTYGPLGCSPDQVTVTDAPGDGLPFGWDEADAFGVTGVASCAPVGYTADDIEDLAVADLVEHEEATVEDVLWRGLYGVDVLTAAESLGSFGLRQAIAKIEHETSRRYGVRGVIHVPRDLAQMATADGSLVVKSGQLTTALGTPAVAGAGYSGSKIVGTPPLVGVRSEPVPQGNTVPEYTQNRVTAVVERSYLIGSDACGAVSAEVTS